MKKIKYIFLLILLIFPSTLLAVSTSDVRYKVYDYIVDASLDISGNMKVKEVIGIKGTFNGYIRDLIYKNSMLNSFTGEISDFEGSNIYNAGSLNLIKVGTVNYNGDLDFDVFENVVKESKECSYKNSCYQRSSIIDGISLKMFNETEDDITYFYIEYTLSNVVVIHEDVAEVYYNFIGKTFDNEIRRYQMRLTLPTETKEEVRVWAHGPLTGNVSLIKDNKTNTYHGGYMEVKDLPANTPVDMRLVFPKNIIMVEHPYLKKSGVVALDKILDVENKRADEANRQRRAARIKVYSTYILTGIYFVIMLELIIHIYIKYDKERKSSFEGEYYRDFIDDYDVTVIEYLFDKKITEKGFSTSILNMIYKKKIKFEQLGENDYKFTKVSDKGLDEAEKIIMEIIFNDAGDGETTTLEDIKKYAGEVKSTSSPFLNKFNKWKQKVTLTSKKEEFFENNTKIKVLGSIYSFFGFGILFFHIIYEIFNILTIMLVIFTFLFLIYTLAFTKKTVKGIEHFAKWSAFKRFLLDFGRFKEKELPEITLWERYLVYANIFGVAEKLGKEMKIKFNEFNYQNNGDIIYNYMMWAHLNSSINRTINSSMSIAHTSVAKAASSSYSSGGGFGGGFSGGGGFGGGGGGGRGF